MANKEPTPEVTINRFQGEWCFRVGCHEYPIQPYTRNGILVGRFSEDVDAGTVVREVKTKANGNVRVKVEL
jgi:hypothetical protein